MIGCTRRKALGLFAVVSISTVTLTFTLPSKSLHATSRIANAWRYFTPKWEVVVLGTLVDVHQDSLVQIEPPGWDGLGFSYGVGQIEVEEVLKGNVKSHRIPVIWYSRSWRVPNKGAAFNRGDPHVEGEHGLWVLTFGGDFMWHRYRFSYVTADSIEAAKQLISSLEKDQ